MRPGGNLSRAKGKLGACIDRDLDLIDAPGRGDGVNPRRFAPIETDGDDRRKVPRVIEHLNEGAIIRQRGCQQILNVTVLGRG